MNYTRKKLIGQAWHQYSGQHEVLMDNTLGYIINKCVPTTQDNIPKELNPHDLPCVKVHFMSFVQKLRRNLDN